MSHLLILTALLILVLLQGCGGGQEPLDIQPANDLVPTTVVLPVK
jgi:hypothetical protein